MHDQPSPSELIAAVKHFIDETAKPQLQGHAAFHARVASNVLATLLRDLEARPGNDAAELTRLQTLLNAPDETDLAVLNQKLCGDIQNRRLKVDSPGLLDHLKATAIAQVEVDQPKYSGLKTALSQS